MAALLTIMASAVGLAVAAPAQAGRSAAVQEPMPPLPVLTASDYANYSHVGALQRSAADGAMANVTIGKPLVSSDASHSLASLAVRSADGRHNVQVGWTVDRLLNGDDDPHLFVIHRVDGTDACYNVCGFEPYAASTVRPGAPLPVATGKRFGIQHFDGRWWVSYDNQWLGYFPDSLWSGAFTQTAVVNYFGEVSGTGDPSCSEMGNGKRVEDTQAARFGSVSLLNGTPASLVRNQLDGIYGFQMISDRTFRFGGAGRGPC